MNSYKKSIMAVLMAFSLVAPAAQAASPVKEAAVVAAGVAASGYLINHPDFNKTNAFSLVGGLMSGSLYLLAIQVKSFEVIPVVIAMSLVMKELFSYDSSLSKQEQADLKARMIKYELLGALIGIGATAALQ